MPGTVAQVQALVDAWRRFTALRPWESLAPEVALGVVRREGGRDHEHALALLGHGGDQRGLAFFERREAFDALWSGEPSAVTGVSVLSVTDPAQGASRVPLPNGVAPQGASRVPLPNGVAPQGASRVPLPNGVAPQGASRPLPNGVAPQGASLFTSLGVEPFVISCVEAMQPRDATARDVVFATALLELVVALHEGNLEPVAAGPGQTVRLSVDAGRR